MRLAPLPRPRLAVWSAVGLFLLALGATVGLLLKSTHGDALGESEARVTRFVTGAQAGMNRTLLDECFRVAGRQTWYITPAEIQRDLDTFLRYYNLERSHQGYRLKGRTPAQVLREALKRKALPPIVPDPEETAETEAEKLVA